MSKVIVFTERIILQGLPALILRRPLLGKTNWSMRMCLDVFPVWSQNNRTKSFMPLPTKEELKKVVFHMSTISAADPDRISGKFYHSCWDIISDDLLEMVQFFFRGHSIPKFISHAFQFYSQKNHPNKLSELRSISLSNFTNKVISKLLCLRLAPILPHLISENQSGFVQNRIISENIMFAEEIIHNIKKPKKVIMLL